MRKLFALSIFFFIVIFYALPARSALISWGTPTVYQYPVSSYSLQLNEDLLAFDGMSERDFPADSVLDHPGVQLDLPFTASDRTTISFNWESTFIADKTVAFAVLIAEDQGGSLAFDTRPAGTGAYTQTENLRSGSYLLHILVQSPSPDPGSRLALRMSANPIPEPHAAILFGLGCSIVAAATRIKP